MKSNINWQTGEMPQNESLLILAKFKSTGYNHQAFDLLRWDTLNKKYFIQSSNGIYETDNPIAWAIVE